MWKIIDRYIFREVLTPFSLTLSALLIILLTEQTARLVELFVNKGVSLWAGAKVFFYLLPAFLVMGIPISVLIATIIAFSRLTADTEITAFRACGLSLFRLARPVLAFSILTFILTFSLSVWAQPMVGRSLKSAAIDMVRQEFSLGLEPGLFNEPFERMMIYVDAIPAPNQLQGVVIYDFRNAERKALILAREGTILNDPGSDTIGFRLTEGSEHTEEAEAGRYQWITFGTYEFKINLDAALRQDASNGATSQDIEELKRRHASGEDLNRSELRRLGEYYKNFAFPFSCMIFGTIGIPLGLVIRKSGRMGGFAAGIAAALFYYLLMMVGDFLAAYGALTPPAAVWVPNLTLSVLTLVLAVAGTGARFRRWFGSSAR